MAESSYGDIGQRTAAWAAKVALEHAIPIIVLSDYAQSKPIPKNTAEQVKFNRLVPYTVSTTQLTEGVTPTSHKTSYVQVPVTLGQYGDVAGITDRVHDLSEDPVLRDASILSGQQAAETIEMVTWGVIKGGTNVVYAATANTSRSQVATPISLSAQRTATVFLQAQRGMEIREKMDSSIKYGQESIEAAFISFGHTDLAPDIRDLPGFIPSSTYGSGGALPNELGRVENVRYILSPLLEPFLGSGAAVGTTGMTSKGGVNVDVYPIVTIAKYAFGAIGLRGSGAITPTVINPTPSAADVLGQRGFVGWKTYFAAVILNQAWLVRTEVGASALNGVS